MTTQGKRRQKRGGKLSSAPGSVRIIGGEWRGRRLPVADAPGLRPSGDRARETLFNWLQPHIRGARCADLFAGTGALGFEAASRGAREVFLIERSRSLAAMLRDSVERLDARQVAVVNADALEWLKFQPPGSLDIIFVDPPFETDLSQRALEGLGKSDCLASGGLVYLESPSRDRAGTPAGFVQSRERALGDVRMELLSWQPGN